MATDLAFADYVRDQASSAGDVTHRKMFGEFALYCNGTVVGLICDNQFFLKPTPEGRALLGRVKEAAPYEGAKPHFLVDAQLDDRSVVSELVRVTCGALPAPKPKKTKAVVPPAPTKSTGRSKSTPAVKTGAPRKRRT
jgi:TfoX/Sxy family transcriptional regulator of competence genes